MASSTCPNCAKTLSGNLESITAHVQSCSPATESVLPLADKKSDNEKGFALRVVSLFKRNNWKAYHTYRSDKSEPGFPDIVATAGGMTIWAELKMPRGKPTPEQVGWLDELSKDHAENVFLWTPSDMPTIEKVATYGLIYADTCWVNRRGLFVKGKGLKR